MNSFQIKVVALSMEKEILEQGLVHVNNLSVWGEVGLLRQEVQEFKASLVYIVKTLDSKKGGIQLWGVVFEAMLRAVNSRPRANFSLFCRLLL